MINQQQEELPESKAARWAYRVALIPLLGILYASLPKLRGNLVPHLVSIMIIGIYEYSTS